MLAESKNMNIFTKTSQIVWDDEEWNLVAAELKRQSPRRNTDNYYRFDFSTMEIEDAAEMVLPQERQRSYELFDAIRRPLFNAFERMKKNPKNSNHVPEGGQNAAGHVTWSNEEYVAVMCELYRMNPAYMDNECALLDMIGIRQAMLVLEPHRRRNFKQLVTLRTTFSNKWNRNPPIENTGPKLASVEFTTGTIVEPKPRKSDGYHAIASAMHEAFQSPPAPSKSDDEPHKRKAYVTWTPSEWVLIAREMRRQNPHLNFFASKFTNIDLPALRDAQRNIFPLERRKSLSGSLGLQGPLMQAFRTLRAELDAEREAEDRAKLNEKEPESPAVLVEEVAASTPEPVAVTPVTESPNLAAPIEQVYRDSAQTDFIAAVTNAAVPLMQLLISEVSKNVSASILSQLTAAVQSAVEAAKPAQVAIAPPATVIAPHPVLEAAAAPEINALTTLAKVGIVDTPTPAVPPPRLTAAEVAAFNNVVPKPKKPKIVLLGPMGKQKTDIEHTFPQYKFVFIEHGHAIKEAADGCELFLAYNSHLNSFSKNDIKRYVPIEKMRYIEGSLTAVKRQINVWEATK